MKDTLRIALVQPEIKWHEPELNIAENEKFISTIDGADLIVLPEMWSSGFTMKAERFAPYADQSIQKMKEWSLSCKSGIIGSLIFKENDNYYNRLFYISNGKIQATYDKRHLFGYAGEDRFFTSGSNRLIIEIEGWRIFPNICYDLRFPVWCRNTDEYDILLFTANWPAKRIDAWDTLLKARAIENQCYVLGVNCMGKDAWNNIYNGHSAIVSYDGSIMQSLHDKTGIIYQKLERKPMKEFREALPFLKDRDSFKIIDS